MIVHKVKEKVDLAQHQNRKMNRNFLEKNGKGL
jgi:hypothetical protein